MLRPSLLFIPTMLALTICTISARAEDEAVPGTQKTPDAPAAAESPRPKRAKGSRNSQKSEDAKPTSKDDADGYYGSLLRGPERAKDLREEEGYYGTIKPTTSIAPTPAVEQQIVEQKPAEPKPDDPKLVETNNATPADSNQTDKSITQTSSSKGQTEEAPAAILQAEGQNRKPPSAMARGIDFFNKQAFHTAENCFQEACETAPTDQSAHYWLAKTRVQLHDADGAHDEFEIAFRLNPFSDLGRQAKSEMVQTFETSTLERRPPADPEWMVNQTLMTIRRQTHEAGASRRLAGELLAQQRITDGNRAARQIADSMSPFGWHNHSFSRFTNWNQYSEISDPIQIRTHYTLTDARVQAAKARQDGTVRAGNLQEAANGLYEQLAEPWRPGHPRLRAFGTNLYVRYYGGQSWDDPGPAPADPPVLAKEERANTKPYAAKPLVTPQKRPAQ